MLNFGNKEFRNLQQQVIENADELEKIKQSLGTALPDPIPGPMGPMGRPGIGQKGERGSLWTVGTDFPASPKDGDCHLKDSYVYQYKNNQWIPYGSIQGNQGIPGQRGQVGEMGPRGLRGPMGPQGPKGDQLIIQGPVATTSLMPAPNTAPRNYAYLVGAAAPYALYVVSDSGNGLVWVNVGTFATLDNIRTIVLDVPENATSGTLTVDQVNLLKDNDCVLQLGDDIYHKTEDQEGDGYWVYSSFNNVYISVITVMVAGSWTKTTYRNNFVPDAELSLLSANSVENKVITEKFNYIVEDNLIWSSENYSFNEANEQHPILPGEYKVQSNEQLTMIVKDVVRNISFGIECYYYDVNETRINYPTLWIENGNYKFNITVPQDAVKLVLGYYIQGTGSYSSAALFRGLAEEHIVKLNEDIKVHVEDIHPEQTNFIKGKLIYSGSAKTNATSTHGQLELKNQVYDFKPNTSYNYVFTTIKNHTDVVPYVSLRFYKDGSVIKYQDIFDMYFPGTFTTVEDFDYVDIYGVWYSLSGVIETIEAEISWKDILIYEANGTTLPYAFTDLLTKERFVHDHRLKTLYLDGDITNMDKDNYVTLSYRYEYAPASVWWGILDCKWQGSSSLQYPKKNFTIKFATDLTIKEA